MPMEYTLKQADKLDGVPSERTLKRHLKKGRISGIKNNNGHWVIDASELCRAYDIKIDQEIQDDKHGMPNRGDKKGHIEGRGLPDSDNTYLQKLIDKLETEVKDYKDREVEWNKQIERRDEHLQNLTQQLENAHNRLLTYQEPTKEKRKWWNFFQ